MITDDAIRVVQVTPERDDVVLGKHVFSVVSGEGTRTVMRRKAAIVVDVGDGVLANSPSEVNRDVDNLYVPLGDELVKAEHEKIVTGLPAYLLKTLKEGAEKGSKTALDAKRALAGIEPGSFCFVMYRASTRRIDNERDVLAFKGNAFHTCTSLCVFIRTVLTILCAATSRRSPA